jgi:Pyrimidine dimer DNA glycosylase
MRMWLVSPKLMCRQHLLGEHVEIHMLVGTIKRNKSVQGYVDNGLIDTSLIQSRHDELVKEMVSRGYNHKSELLYEDKLHIGTVDSSHSLAELARRCPNCRERIEANG